MPEDLTQRVVGDLLNERQKKAGNKSLGSIQLESVAELSDSSVDKISKTLSNTVKEIKVEVPEITLPPIEAPQVTVPPIEIPEIKIPAPEVTVQERPIKDITVSGFSGFAQSIISALKDIKQSLGGNVKPDLSDITVENPLPVVLTHEGKVYKALSKLAGAIGNARENYVHSTIEHGSKGSIGTSAVQVTTTSIKLEKGVIVKAAAGNGGTVYVGNSDVTANSAEATDGFELTAGESITVPVDDVSKVYVIGSGAGQQVFWFVV
jgi:hypothetical protein